MEYERKTPIVMVAVRLSAVESKWASEWKVAVWVAVDKWPRAIPG
jgi:hypothetical protein